MGWGKVSGRRKTGRRGKIDQKWVGGRLIGRKKEGKRREKRSKMGWRHVSKG